MTGTPFRLPRDWRGNLDVERFPKMLANLEHDFMFYEWRLNLRTGQTRERVIDDIINQEFPVINSWMQGYKTRYTWNVLMGRSNRAEDPRFCGFVVALRPFGAVSPRPLAPSHPGLSSVRRFSFRAAVLLRARV